MSERLRASETFATDPGTRCRCGKQADAYIEIHAVDYCTPGQQTVNALVCREHLVDHVRRCVGILVDGPDFCGTCQLPIVTLSDMIVRLQPL